MVSAALGWDQPIGNDQANFPVEPHGARMQGSCGMLKGDLQDILVANDRKGQLLKIILLPHALHDAICGLFVQFVGRVDDGPVGMGPIGRGAVNDAGWNLNEIDTAGEFRKRFIWTAVGVIVWETQVLVSGK